ncbi:MAG TPA: thioesterase family protein [Anaerolineaceae bacterium]|nr:thioesterase family protein [Anaerolineaceae bacterium]HPN52468.1 thioesterase family protein [Anaerolineaceae bacterium]
MAASETFKYYVPILIRYNDIDAQWHVNNARAISFIEQARMSYLKHLGLWDAESFQDLGLIVADVHASYIAPIKYNQSIRVGVRVQRLGNKSMTFDYQIEDKDTHAVLVKAETVMVAYDYHTLKSIEVPENWRKKILAYEE